MSSVKISGDTSGVITVAAPAVSGTNTITMPAATGTMALTSDIPAGGGMTLLTTLATTSGTTSTTATLDLSTYKNLAVYGWSVGQGTDSGSILRWGGNGGTQIGISNGATASTEGAYFVLWHDLANKFVFSSNFMRYAARSQNTLAAIGVGLSGVNNTITTSTTSIIFDWTGGQTFDLGSISIYGVK